MTTYSKRKSVSLVESTFFNRTSAMAMAETPTAAAGGIEGCQVDGTGSFAVELYGVSVSFNMSSGC